MFKNALWWVAVIGIGGYIGYTIADILLLNGNSYFGDILFDHIRSEIEKTR